MANVWVDTGGAATNSGSRNTNSALLSGTAATVSGSVVTLDGSPDLSTIVTSGDSQDSIRIADATNSNQKIFWITAADNGAKTVTVSVAPTGVVSSAWSIGGRCLLSTITGAESFLRAGDTVNFNNSPASAAGTLITARVAGDTTSGYVKWKGTSGYPTLTCTDASDLFTGNVAFQWIEGLTLTQQGATQNCIELSGTAADNWVIYNNKFTDSGGPMINIASGATSCRIIGNEFSGTNTASAHGISASDNTVVIAYNYIHDLAGTTCDGINLNSSSSLQFIFGNIIDTCTGRGILKASTSTHILALLQNIIYGCGNSGFENANHTLAVLFNNIFMNNGDAAGEYNLEGGSMFAALSLGNYNCFYDGGAGDNLLNYTAGANDITTDPDFAGASSGNFALNSGSPCKATGFPGAFIGGLSTGYMDMGPIQRQEAGAGGGLLTHPGMAGGMRG